MRQAERANPAVAEHSRSTMAQKDTGTADPRESLRQASKVLASMQVQLDTLL